MTRNGSLTILAAFVWILPSAVVTAEEPTNMNLRYSIHDDPNDPESPVVFIVELDLRAADTNGDEVGWEVKQARFKKLDGLQVIKEWFADWPEFDTVDGLWWIEHVEAKQPELEEFTLPPLLAGTAQRKNASGPGLEFDLVGESYTPPQGGPPYPVTSSLTHFFQEVGGSTPEQSGEDTPTESEEGEPSA